MKTQIVHLSSQQKHSWYPVFCHIPAELEKAFPSGVTVSEDQDVTVTLDRGKLRVPSRYFGHVLRALALEQKNGQDGFLPDECIVGFGMRRFKLSYSGTGNDSIGWYLSPIYGPLMRLWRRVYFRLLYPFLTKSSS